MDDYDDDDHDDDDDDDDDGLAKLSYSLLQCLQANPRIVPSAFKPREAVKQLLVYYQPNCLV